jgi:hypothetical protein
MNASIGAVLLIGLGVLFPLEILGVPVVRHIGMFWPVLLIVIGLFMLQRRMGRSSAQPPSPAEPLSPQGL